MPFKTGQWGIQERERSKKRLDYFKKATYGFRKHNHLKLRGEAVAKKLLIGASYVDEPSHDFIWHGKKIEVKSAELCIKKGGYKGWYFSITNESQLICDYFLCIGLKRSKVFKVFLIPAKELNVSKTIYIGQNINKPSKYEKYLWRGGDIT